MTGGHVVELQRNPTRAVRIGSITIGAGHPIAAQSMTATHTQDVAATLAQANALHAAGAGVVRIAVDSKKDAAALPAIRAGTPANLAIDLQENYRLCLDVAPHVDKLRYNPGHLYHHEPTKPWQEKVKFIAGVAADNDCVLRVGVNCGSVDPAKKEKFDPEDSIGPMLASALEHCELLDSIGFTRYAVSLKDSDPRKVIDVNRRFAAARPDVPLHLGVTEAGMPPDGIIKTRIAFEQLISRGIGDTVRVSLTPEPGGDRTREVIVAQEMLQTMGLRSFAPLVIACPGCGRTTSTVFQELADRIQGYLRAQMPEWRGRYPGVENMHVAVMGCVVNGPGESKHANIGISLPGSGETPVAPVFVDGVKTVTLKGDRIAEEFQRIVDQYVRDHYGSAEASTAAAR